MIQRIQTVYLVVAIVCAAALFPLRTPAAGPSAMAWPWFTSAVYLLTSVCVIACGVAVAQFGNRARQLRTATVASLVALAVAVLLGVGYAVNGEFASGETEAYTSLALPVAAFAMATLARRAIAKDIALVRSMDRLR